MNLLLVFAMATVLLALVKASPLFRRREVAKHDSESDPGVVTGALRKRRRDVSDLSHSLKVLQEVQRHHHVRHRQHKIEEQTRRLNDLG